MEDVRTTTETMRQALRQEQAGLKAQQLSPNSYEMKTLLIALLLLTNCLHLKAVQSSSFISNAALCRPSCGDREELTFSPNGGTCAIPSYTCGGRSNYQCSMKKAGRLRSCMATRKYRNGAMKTESLHMSSSLHNEHLQHHRMNRIRRFIQIKLTQLSKYLRILLISSILSFSILPMRAVVASSSASDASSYYLQNNLNQRPKPQQSSISIQTQPSQPYYNPSSSRNTNTVRSRRQYPSSTRYIQQNNNNKPTTAATVQKQRVKRTTLLIMLLTLAASSFRASMRKSKVVRNITPFGVIRNISRLGNGVSVIRVCMALEFTNDDNDKKEANCLLNKLYLEEKELFAKISTSSVLSQDPLGQEMQLKGAYSFRQRKQALICSNVAETLLQYTKYMRYGSVESIRVPFVEEALKEFRRVTKEERHVFATTTASTTSKINRSDSRNDPRGLGEKQEERQHPQNGYILATILLAIKGDKTSVQLPFGIIRKRDITRSLSRIASDAKMDDCLVGAEIMWMPQKNSEKKKSSVDNDASDEEVVLLSEKEVLTSFPELVP